MKNKGFVFVETIVVIVVLSLGLVMVYQSFSNVLSNNKRRAAYNDIAYIYRTYYIEDFISSLNIEGYIDYYMGKIVTDDDNNYIHGGKKIQVFDCNNPILYNIDINVQTADLPSNLSAKEQSRLAFCEKIKSTYKAKNIYITNYNVNDLKKCTTRAGKTATTGECDMSKEENKVKYDALNTMSPSMIYYLRTLNGTEANTYRIIIEYEEQVIDTDSSITKIKTKKSATAHCPNGYVENGDNCQKTVKKKYYSNVALIKKK